MSAARSRRANDKHNHLQRTPILVMGCSLLIACCIAFGGTNWTASAQPSEDQLPEQNAIVEPGYYQETIGSYEAISQSAMKAHDNNRRDILRQVHTELKAIEVNERRNITEADVDAMLKRVIKQTKETLDGSIKAGNNQERTDTLTEQVAILEGYLPEQVEGEALMALIDEVVAETGATTKKDMGRVMGALTQRTGGNFDKAAAAATLNQRLS
ncbi:MAG: GatB/YqeY domain-containing protein [Eggerthellaceae bacterium]|nr:GatB/YqeY domain-containing protein [Eggerthellaceae bacterium]